MTTLSRLSSTRRLRNLIRPGDADVTNLMRWESGNILSLESDFT